MPNPLWPCERDALRPPEKLTVSEWADKHRVLDAHQPEPGPWRTSRVPYLRAIQDAFAEPAVVMITIIKSTQVGGTEAMINCVGYAVDQDPGPAMWVVPKNDLIGDFVHHRLMPAIEATQRLNDQVRDGRTDWTKRGIVFERMPLFLGSANVPADLASKPVRFLFLDEVDKFPLFSGREADPISLAIERTSNFHDRKIVLCSTPTTEGGYIWQSWEKSDKRSFHVPCPACGHYQILVMDNVRWPEEVHGDPEALLRTDAARYECAKCRALIPETQKRGMLERGVWACAGAEVRSDGKVYGQVTTQHAGFHLSTLYSPWRSWSRVGAEFLASRDDHRRLMNFNNSWLGNVWQEKVTETSTSHIAALVEPYPANLVPDGCETLTCGVDVQGRELYAVVRGWGAGFRSWLIRTERLFGFEELEALTMQASWARASGGSLQIALTCVDSGYRTDEVYEFCRNSADMARPTKGYAVLNSGALFNAVRIERTIQGKPFGVQVWHLNTALLKDKLSRLQNAGPDQPCRWSIHSAPPDDYMRHMTSEHKVIRRSKTSGLATEMWERRPNAGANHWWDCEVYALAAAEMLHVHLLGGQQLVGSVASVPADPMGIPTRDARRGWLHGGKGFLGTRKGWLSS